jgi:tetratricopeptide (TPR) repeat protein
MRPFILLLAIPLVLAAQAPQPQPALSGEQLFESRRYDEAKAAFQAQLARNRNDTKALYYMGRIEYAQGNSGKAVDWFEKAVKRDERSSEIHTWLGNALGDEAQKASKFRQPFLARRVKSEYERAVELDPKSIDAREGLVGFYSIAPGFMGGDMEKARAQAAEIAKLNPIRGHLQTGRVAERAKDSVTAEREYNALIASYPDSVIGYNALAVYYRAHSRWDDSFATHERLMAKRPDDLPVHLSWAGTSAMSGKNLERGEREAKFYLANAKDAPQSSLSSAHWRLGMIYEKTARKEMARAEYKEAIRLWPSNQNAKRSLEALK